MILPDLHGNLPEENVIFYIAADENYFNLYGKMLINSIRVNFNYGIHLHLYNPSDDTKKYLKNRGITYSFEYFDEKSVEHAFQIYKSIGPDWEFTRRRSKMLKPGENLEKLKKELVRTYYACSRFVRLHEILTKPTYVLMLDTDSIVRKPFYLLNDGYDIFIYEKTHKKHVPYTQHLASTIFYTGSDDSLKLIRDHAQLILEEFKNNTFYWFLDQETLDLAIQKYKKMPLEKSYVDFDMENDSYIWCAKGPRKNFDIWMQESKKYQSV